VKVNKALDMLSEYYASGGKSEAFKEHQQRLADYLWLAADGMKMQVILHITHSKEIVLSSKKPNNFNNFHF
jgi:hypothetical protein